MLLPPKPLRRPAQRLHGIPDLDEPRPVPPAIAPAITYRDLLRDAVVGPPSLVDPLLPAGSRAILAGPPNAGKTWLTLSLARAVASGRPWLGHFSTCQGSVLVVDEETDRFQLGERLRLLEAGEPLGEELPIAFEVGQGLRLDTADGYHRLDELLAHHRPALVILDSLIRFHCCNENDAGEMARLFAGVTRLVRTHGAAVLFTDHQRKRGEVHHGAAEALRGSSEKVAWCDTLLSVAPVGAHRLTLSHTKARYGAKLPDVAVDLGLVPDSARPTCGGVPAAAEGLASADVVAAVGRITERDGPDVADAAALVAELGVADTTARRRLRALVASGELVERSIPTRGRPKTVFGLPGTA